MRCEGDLAESFLLEWDEVTERARWAHRGGTRATEDGACALAVLALGELLGHEVVERSKIGEGCDYWHAPKGTVDPSEGVSFEECSRLEVSGILHGSDSEVKKRVRKKVQRVVRVDQDRPGFIMVVEFSTPRIRVECV